MDYYIKAPKSKEILEAITKKLKDIGLTESVHFEHDNILSGKEKVIIIYSIPEIFTTRCTVSADEIEISIQDLFDGKLDNLVEPEPKEPELPFINHYIEMPNSEEIHRTVQERLFELGYKWAGKQEAYIWTPAFDSNIYHIKNDELSFNGHNIGDESLTLTELFDYKP